MAEITQTIAEYAGAVPDRATQDQTEFNAAASAYAAWMSANPPQMNLLASQMNAVSTEVGGWRDDAVASGATAIASANFKGAWSGLSGAASIPYCVLHDGKYWQVLTNLADVTTSEPSPANSDWAEVSTGAGAGGASRIEISSNRDLTTEDLRKLAITATTGGLRVRMPLATSLEEDGVTWIIANTGAHAFDVWDADNHTLGGAMGTLQPNETRAYILLDATEGTWLVMNLLDSSTGGRIGEAGFIIDTNTPAVFNSASTAYISSVALSSTKVFVAYTDNGNSSYGTAVVLDISGSIPIAGTPFVFESASTTYISLSALSESLVVASYVDNTNSAYGTSIALSVSGTTITAGTPLVFESANTSRVSSSALDSTRVIICYRDNGNSSYGTAIAITATGTSLSKGAAVVFESATTADTVIAALSDVLALVSYTDGGNGSKQTYRTLSVSGTAITVNAEYAATYSGSAKSLCALNSSSALLAFSNSSNASAGTAVVLSVTGTTISEGGLHVFESASTAYISSTKLAENRVLVTFRDNGNASYGTAIILGIDGTVVSSGDPVVYNAGTTNYQSVVALSDLSAVVTYSDVSNSSYGTAQILERR